MNWTNGEVDRKHYVTDIVVLSLVYALLHTTKTLQEQNIDKTDGLLELELEWKEGISEMLESSIFELQTYIESFLYEGVNLTIAHRTKQKIDTYLPNTMNYIAKQDITLEILAMYILHFNFVRRDEPLHSNFKELYEMRYTFSTIVDTLSDAGVSIRYRSRMSKLAKEIIMRLK